MRFPKCIFLALASLSFCVASRAQLPIQWQKSYGGTNLDEGKVIRQTTDGGFVFIGTSASSDGDLVGAHGLYDCWVVKTSPSGAIQWQKPLGGSASDGGNNIRQTSDGGYIAACHTMSNDGDITGNHGKHDAWIVKLAPDGNIVWQKALGSPGQEMAYSVEQTFDGGYVVAGSSDSTGGDVGMNHGKEDFWLVKLSASGNIEWEKTFGGSGRDIATVVVQTADSGYIVGGATESNDGDVTSAHGNKDVWLIKLSASGNMTWQKTYGGSGNDLCGWEQIPGALKQTSNGYIFVGWTNSTDGDVNVYHGDYDFWVVRLTTAGEIIWENTYGGSLDDEANSIQLTNDGGFIVAGVEQSNDGDVSGNHGGYDFWLLKLNSIGDLQWQKPMGGAALGLGDCAFSVETTPDSGYIVAGYSESTDGDVTGNHGSYDFWAVKLLCTTGNLGPSQLCKGDTVTLTNAYIGGTWSSTSTNVSVTSSGHVTGVSAGTAVITYVITTFTCGLAKPLSFVTINALPTPVISSGGLVMSTTIPYATYQWYSAGGPIAGANGPTYTASSYGDTYRVYVTDNNGCSDSSAAFTLITNAVTGINAQNVGIYPNPVNNMIYINGAGHKHVKVFNSIGSLVREGADTTFIDVTGLSLGCYLVQIWNDKGELIYRGTVMKR